MAATDTYLPRAHCCICIQAGKHVAAHATVMTEGRNYQVCLDHGSEITRHGFTAAIQNARRNPTKGAV